MDDIIKYNFILIKKIDNKYMGWSKANNKPSSDALNNFEWIEWNKELPDDIDTTDYKYKNNELTRS